MTQEYIGTKQVTAWKQEKDGIPGYGVKYEDGYISWSPANTFEAAYLPMGNVQNLPPFHQRLKGEITQLEDRLNKLSSFLSSSGVSNLTEDQIGLLSKQVCIMEEYLNILKIREEGLQGDKKNE